MTDHDATSPTTDDPNGAFPSGLDIIARIATGGSNAADVLAEQGVSLEWIAARLRHIADHGQSEQARVMALHELRVLADSAGIRPAPAHQPNAVVRNTWDIGKAGQDHASGQHGVH